MSTLATVTTANSLLASAAAVLAAIIAYLKRHPIKAAVRKVKPARGTFHMGDAVNAARLPKKLPAYAGYVNGRFRSFPFIKGLFPKARLLGIAVSADVLAGVLDIETGDAGPQDAGPYVLRCLEHGIPARLYMARSTIPAVLANLRAHNIPRKAVMFWIAHPDDQPHICTPARCGTPITADATQYLFAGGYDESLCKGYFLP
jgi:hypothetical protein